MEAGRFAEEEAKRLAEEEARAEVEAAAIGLSFRRQLSAGLAPLRESEEDETQRCRSMARCLCREGHPMVSRQLCGAGGWACAGRFEPEGCVGGFGEELLGDNLRRFGCDLCDVDFCLWCHARAMRQQGLHSRLGDGASATSCGSRPASHAPLQRSLSLGSGHLSLGGGTSGSRTPLRRPSRSLRVAEDGEVEAEVAWEQVSPAHSMVHDRDPELAPLSPPALPSPSVFSIEPPLSPPRPARTRAFPVDGITRPPTPPRVARGSRVAKELDGIKRPPTPPRPGSQQLERARTQQSTSSSGSVVRRTSTGRSPSSPGRSSSTVGRRVSVVSAALGALGRRMSRLGFRTG